MRRMIPYKMENGQSKTNLVLKCAITKKPCKSIERHTEHQLDRKLQISIVFGPIIRVLFATKWAAWLSVAVKKMEGEKERHEGASEVYRSHCIVNASSSNFTHVKPFNIRITRYIDPFECGQASLCVPVHRSLYTYWRKSGLQFTVNCIIRILITRTHE